MLARVGEARGGGAAAEDLREHLRVVGVCADERAAHALALYSSISNIKWDYDDALAARGRLGGVVSVAASRSVKRFDVDDAGGAGGRAPFDVAQDLWALIDPTPL